MTGGPGVLRPLTAVERLAVAMADDGAPVAAITYRTRLTADQIAAAVDRHARWERLQWGLPYTAPAPRSEPAPEAPAGPTPRERAVELHAGGMGVNQVAVATGLPRAEVLAAIGTVEAPAWLLPAGDVPPVLQGVGGSIACQRPAVRRLPVIPKAPSPRPPVRTVRQPATPATALPPPIPAPAPRTPAPSVLEVGSRAWKQLAASDDVRAWAIADGWAVPPPGVRLPGAIVRAYTLAHPDHGSAA